MLMLLLQHEQNSSAKTGVGTPIYMAPEIIYGGNRYDAKASPEVCHACHRAISKLPAAVCCVVSMKLRHFNPDFPIVLATESGHLVVWRHSVRHALRLLPLQQQRARLHPQNRHSHLPHATRRAGTQAVEAGLCSAASMPPLQMCHPTQRPVLCPRVLGPAVQSSPCIPHFGQAAHVSTTRLASAVQVSAECKDLLTRLLVADSEQRLSMEDIKNHSWFTHALPSGAIQMNDWYMREANGINEVHASGASLQMCARSSSLPRTHQLHVHAASVLSQGDSTRLGLRTVFKPAPTAMQVMSRIDALIQQAQKRGSPGEPVVSVTF